MSWSVSFIGKPEAVKKALAEASQTMSGQSKDEYNACKPHLIGLVDQHVGEKIAVRIVANGHATFEAGRKITGTCAVDINQVYGLVE